MPALRLFFIGAVEPPNAAGFLQGLQAAKQQFETEKKNNPQIAAPSIHLLINSYGGDMGVAFAIYNVLRACQWTISTYNIGEVSSAATIIFLAGDQRYAAKYSLFKFHPMTWDLAATGAHGAGRIHDTNASIEAFHALQAKLYQERTKMSADEIAGALLKTVCITSQEAQIRGIIDAEREPFI